MKSPKGWTVAVRDPKGGIHVKKEALPQPSKLVSFPVMRGFVALYYALSLGIKALGFSAEKAYDETTDSDDDKNKGSASPMSPATMGLTVAVSILLAVGLFILLPLYATKLAGMVLPPIAEKTLLFNLVDGVIRVVVFLGYIVLVGLWKEMRRIFQYHGAEHKVIHAYEKGRGFEVDDIRDMSPLHPRCGTSFLLIVMLISILVFSFIPQSWALVYKFLSRVVMMPLIAGISYETLKLSARMRENPLVRLLVLPGLFLQRLTTREPDDAQIEVAVRALTEVLSLKGGQAGETVN